MKNILFAAGFLLLISCQNEPERVVNPDTLKIDALVKAEKQAFNVPGIAVGMIKDEQPVYANAYGVKSLDSKEAMTTQSIFHMASVSKPFVATAVVQLVENGKIDLEEKLTYYLPYFVMADERYKDITIKQMLNHTSGIPDVEDYEWDNPQFDDGAAERFSRSQESVQLEFAPGSEYNYSNTAFDILCDVISKVSGMTFETYVKEHIFEPVGMKNSTFFKPDVPENLATKPHVLDDSLQWKVSEVYPYNRRHAGSSTLHSNVDDMLLWAEVNMNKGIINGTRIYNESSFELLTTSQAEVSETSSVGLSWFLNHSKDEQVIYHQGGDTGYRTFFAFIPEKKAAITLMVNSDYFWSNYGSYVILNNLIYNDSIVPKAPIHFKLKDHILNDGFTKTKEIYLAEKQKDVQKYFFGANYLDDLGYWLLDRDYPEEALEIFQFMVTLEPEESGWPDSVADAYKALDSIDLAVKWYQKALAINPEQDFSREKLNELLNLEK